MADQKSVGQELEAKYEHLRSDYQQEHQPLVSLDEARSKKPDYFNNDHD